MAQIETWLNQEMTEAVKVQYLDGNLFSQDNAGNLIGVLLTKNGVAYSGGGTVAANVIRADGATVAVSGALSGNAATVVLPQSAYAIPGVTSIVIKLTANNEVTTIGAVVANIYQSSTDTVVDPGTIIPSIEALIAEIEEVAATIPADYSSLWESVAPAFSTSVAYKAGQYVRYDGVLYKFKNEHAAGEWNSGQAAPATVGDGVYDVSNVVYTSKVLCDTVTVDMLILSVDYPVALHKNHVYEIKATQDATVLNGSNVYIYLDGTLKYQANLLTGVGFVCDGEYSNIRFYAQSSAIANNGTFHLQIEDLSNQLQRQNDMILGGGTNKVYFNTPTKSYGSGTLAATRDFLMGYKCDVSITDATTNFCVAFSPFAAPALRNTLRVGIKNTGTTKINGVLILSSSTIWGSGAITLWASPSVHIDPGESEFLSYKLADIISTFGAGSPAYLLFRFDTGSSGDYSFKIYTAYPENISPFEQNGEVYAIESREAFHSETTERIRTQYDCVFWGDSITAGAGASDYANTYVKRFSEMMGFTDIVNAGVGGETTYTIAARQGGNIVYIPAGNPSTTPFAMTDIHGNPVLPLIGGYLVGTHEIYTRAVTLNGISGDLGYSNGTYTISVNQNFVTKTPIKFPGSSVYGDLTIIFTGTNNWNADKPTQDIPYIKAMLENIKTNKYIIMGMYKANNATYEAAMADAFGEHFLNTRELLSAYGMAIEGLTPTAEDTAAMNAGLVPPSLLSDNIHPNDYGHEAIAKLLYQHALFLGY